MAAEGKSMHTSKLKMSKTSQGILGDGKCQCSELTDTEGSQGNQKDLCTI